ncbi:hypothetical protein [Ruania rhizosphaerae]|uniref:hypothetical protein n=1 Tax=Ruania rhizosphaerae TaxID=1840413 RepID=UPI00135A4C58|nr:hypothetical protein [Ruania rhizosphaerae]
MSQQPRWYRVMAWLSGAVWLTGVWIVTSLPIVTAPGAMVALHDGGGQLSRGEIPSWVRYRKVLSRKWRPAWVVAVACLTPWVAAVAVLMIAVQQASPILGGVALALGVLAGMANAVGWYVVAITDGSVRSMLHRTVLALSLRPISAVIMSLPWWLGAAVVVMAPARVVVVAAIVAVSVSAAVASMIARSHRPLASCTTVRQRVSAGVLEPRIGRWDGDLVSATDSDERAE